MTRCNHCGQGGALSPLVLMFGVWLCADYAGCQRRYAEQCAGWVKVRALEFVEVDDE